MALRIIRIRHLSLPQNAREAFTVLEQDGLISPKLMGKLQAMVGFRNIAVHDYTDLDLEVVRSIVDHNLDDLLEFNKTVLQM